ncbi:MAG: hypothetical protein Q7S16_03385 [bacterium]|nr:hypothetical protein [bacterium]
MGTPVIKAKDALGAITSNLRAGGRSSFGGPTRLEKMKIADSSKLGKLLVMNKSRTIRSSQLKQVIKDVEVASAKDKGSQRQFVTWKDAGAITRKELKILSEEQKKAEGGTAAHGEGEGMSEFEQKLEERKEKAEREIANVEAQGKEKAAQRQAIAKSGRNVASESVKEEIRKEQQKEIQAEQARLADEDPKKLARYAIDIPE